MKCTLSEFTSDTMPRSKSRNPDQPWHAGGMGQQKSYEVQQSQMQSSAHEVADWQGCTYVAKQFGFGQKQIKP